MNKQTYKQHFDKIKFIIQKEKNYYYYTIPFFRASQARWFFERASHSKYKKLNIDYTKYKLFPPKIGFHNEAILEY